MQQNYARIQQAGLGLAAISYDSPAILSAFAARRAIAFPLLSDPDSRIIRTYGILNTSVAVGSPTYGIPYPGIYILDSNGVVMAKDFEDDYRERQTAAVILLRNFGIDSITPHRSITAKHISLTTSSTAAEARTGQHVLLTVDVELPAHMHVYAPGTQGYIPVDWKQADSSAARAGAVKFPLPQILFLPAIKEKVPVFQGHFRLTREITMGAPKDLESQIDPSGNLNLQGAIRYQACDDLKCFSPETVPLAWTFRFEPLDTARSK